MSEATNRNDQHEVFETSQTFADLGLRNSLLKALDENGWTHPTHIQAKLIPEMLAGKDLLGQAKTGTGKTAAFALPMLHHADKDAGAQALVLAPTRELATQIVAEINELGKHTPIRAVGIVGGESFDKQLKQLKEGGHIVVGTPGRVMDLHQRGNLKFNRMRWAVLDEVDRMLDIGFRDDIRKILSRIEGEHQTVFVSATISDDIARLSRRFMKPDAKRVETVAKALTVSQVTQTYVPVHKRDKKAMLLHLLNHEEPALTVVFCRMKVTVREVAKFLTKNGIEAFEIHGDLPQEKRNRIIQRLREGKLEVLVASDLAARGLDVGGITHIINYDLPDDPEVYIHRIGRTARAGRSGIAWSFVEPDQGQLFTEIEKLTGVLIERLEYPDFTPSAETQREQEEQVSSRQGRGAFDPAERYRQPAIADQTPDNDPEKFPGGVVPKGPPRRSMTRVRSGRRGK